MPSVDWGFALAVVVTGLAVVFAVLILLVLFCWLLGKVMTAVNKKQSKPKAPKQSKEEKAAKKEAKKASNVAAAVPAVEKGISGDIIAAISAAIAAMTGSGNFKLRSIKRSKGARPVWNQQGIIDNTRPF